MANRKNTEYFIARRLSGKGGRDRRNVMVRIATLTVAISIAVMIISVSVISGFRASITGKLVGFGAHVQVVHLDGNNSLETIPVTRNPILEQSLASIPGLRDMNIYAVKGGIVKTDEAMQGIMLKGVGKDFDWSFFSDNLVGGELPVIGDSVKTKDILISSSLGSLLKIGVEDRVEMLFIQEGRAPRRDRFKVSGIYDTGFGELDLIVIPTDIRNVQRLNGWNEEQITGYELTTTDFGSLKKFAGSVYDTVFESEPLNEETLMVTDITERYPNLFDWLKAHNVNAAVFIIIMLLVALLNMVSALLIILLERTRMIGVLKSLGMANAPLQKIFVLRSAFIIVKGLVWGNIAGIGLCLLQKHYHLVKLDQTGYFLTEVPIQTDWMLIAALNAGTLLVIIALLTIPTNIVSRISPEKTVRYQ